MSDFLGRTLAFPPQPDGRGGLLTVSGVEAVEHSLRALIESQIGDHPFEPRLGWPIEAFMPVQDTDVIAQLIKDCILTWEDRIHPDYLEVGVGIGDEGILEVNILYSLRGDATSRTLAHAFRALS